MIDASFRYGLFGVGRCGCVHGEILIAQGQEVVAVGDENANALGAAAQRLGVSSATKFGEAAEMARWGQGGKLEAVVISSHTKDHARHARPFLRAGIPVYLEKPLTADLAEAFAFVREIGTRKICSKSASNVGLTSRWFMRSRCSTRS